MYTTWRKILIARLMRSIRTWISSTMHLSISTIKNLRQSFLPFDHNADPIKKIKQNLKPP